MVKRRLVDVRPPVRVEELGQEGAELGRLEVAHEEDVGPVRCGM